MGSTLETSLSGTEERALALLGQGISPEIVASAIGVSASRISQLCSEPSFAARVAELRFSNLQRHNERDSSYDSLEDDLIEKMKHMLPFMIKPMEVLRAIQVINAAKRRGSSSGEAITQTATVVQLVMPSTVLQQFTKNDISVNINNQVVKVGDKDLVTMQSARLDHMLAGMKEQEALTHASRVETIHKLMKEPDHVQHAIPKTGTGTA